MKDFLSCFPGPRGCRLTPGQGPRTDAWTVPRLGGDSWLWNGKFNSGMSVFCCWRVTSVLLGFSAPTLFAEEVLAVVTLVRCPDIKLVRTTSSIWLEALGWLLCPTANSSVFRTLKCRSFRIQVLPEPPISSMGLWPW